MFVLTSSTRDYVVNGGHQILYDLDPVSTCRAGGDRLYMHINS